MNSRPHSTARPWASAAAGLCLIVCACLLAPQAIQAAALKPTALRCEFLTNPLGLEATQPLLSWQVASDERGQAQTACQILVASSPELLRHDHGDLWDSGKLATNETIGILYAGSPLVSQEQCYWKVRVWDHAGHATWSQPAEWSMGLLQPTDWQAQWIGYDAARSTSLTNSPLTRAQWIWFAPDGPTPPAGARLFQNHWILPADIKIKSAELTATADDSFRFTINGKTVLTSPAEADSWRHPQANDITSMIHPGNNALLVEAENTSPSPAGLLAAFSVTTEDGQTFQFVTDGGWQAAVSPGKTWTTVPLPLDAWSPVRVVGPYGIDPWGELTTSDVYLPPAPYLRHGFNARQRVLRATLYASALGLVEVHLNGHRVSEDYFTPGWTDYDKRVHYRTYDVTPLVHPGANALGAMLADGWYAGYVGYAGKRGYYGNSPRVRLQLQLDYADGSHAVIASGPDWKAATGPILEADFLKGETYDARRELTGWDQPAFADDKWQPVVTGSEIAPLMQAHPGPPVRVFAELKAKTITEPQPGVYVLNLGQNFAGVARLKVSGEPGQKITLRFAERLNPDGTVYTTNLRTARATDTYICRGGGVETWEPHFTFHGFQYVEITGLTRRPDKDTVTGLALSSDTPVVGSFTCSDPMLNQLHNNIYWTQRANFIDIPTDCPQRDERLGWTGDAQVYVRTATLNCDMAAFYNKWLIDLDEDGQRADGEFPMVAPVKIAGDDGGPAWADSGVICPWTIYDSYGDRRVLERYYPAMTRFIAFCQNRSRDNLLPPAQYHCFGDWLSINADTPKDVICTAYFAASTKLTARAAEVLGKTADAAKYNDLFQRIKAAFNQAYVTDDGRVAGDTQAGYVLALRYGLVEGDRARLAAQHLVENIQARNWHLSTGFIGTKDLMLVLAQIGRNDVADRLIHQDTFPSWGFSIKNGATSIWERWDGWTPDKGFQNPGMNSFAHYSFGAVYQWMLENLGGIRTDTTAWKHVVIAPELDPQLTRVAASLNTIRGPVKTDWQRAGDTLKLTVTLPANTTGTVYLPFTPAAGPPDLTESGHPLASATGVTVQTMESNRAVLAITSGTYHFKVINHP
jgi:alpha-L-rhamnosidase